MGLRAGRSNSKSSENTEKITMGHGEEGFCGWDCEVHLESETIFFISVGLNYRHIRKEKNLVKHQRSIMIFCPYFSRNTFTTSPVYL